MPVERQIFIIAGAVALTILAFGSRVWLRRPPAPSYWAAPIAIVVAFLIVFPKVFGAGWNHVPREATAWLPWLAIAGLVVAMLDAIVRLPWFVRAIFVIALTAISLVLILKFRLATDARTQTIFAIAALSIIAVLWWWSLESSATDGGLTAPILALVITTSLAVVFSLRGNLKLGQLAGGLSAGAGAALLLAIFRRPHVDLSRGAAIVLSVMCVAIIAQAYYTSDLGEGYAAALLATPIFIGLGRIVPATRLPPWQRVTIRVGFLLIPLAIVLTLAFIAYQKANAADAEGEPNVLRTEPASTHLAASDIG